MTLPPARVRATIARIGFLSLLVGAATIFLRPSRLEVVAPSSCPGLLELIGTAAVRADPQLTLGSLLGTLQALAVIAAVMIVTVLVHRTTRSALVAAGVGLAVGIGPLLPSTLAPPWEAAALAALAAAAMTLGRGWLSATPRRGASLAGIIAAVLAAFVVPQWTAVAAVVVAMTAWRQSRRAGVATRVVVSAGAAAGVAGLVWASSALLPAAVEVSSWRTLLACAGPGGRAALAGTAGAAGLAVDLLGPMVLALALLGGIVGLRRAERHRRQWPAVIVVVWLSPALWGAPDLRLLLTPLFVLLWLLAASGLQAIEAMAGRGAPARIGAAVLVGLVPVLQYARVHNVVRDDWTFPIGHERATRHYAAAIANVLPAGSALVEEDSGFELLWRVVLDRRRSAKSLRVVSDGRDAVVAAFGSGPVYALPLAQRRLRDRGVAFEAFEIERRDGRDRTERFVGLARVAQIRPCYGVGPAWIRVDDVVGGGRLALVAGSESARGPIVVYLAGSSPVGVQPDGWPPRTLRGFGVDLLDQRAGPAVSSLEAEARHADPVPADRVLDAPFVTRLHLHRTARAPWSLPVDVGRGATGGLARLERLDAPGGGLELCVAQAFAVTPIGMTSGTEDGAVATR